VSLPSILHANPRLTCLPSDIISTEINFIGNLVGSYNDLVELMILAAKKKVVLHTSIYKLDDFQKAIDDLSAGKVRGRAILVP
jgi:NAD+-dependent secondary alcohol dehydrogenase Adh1